MNIIQWVDQGNLPSSYVQPDRSAAAEANYEFEAKARSLPPGWPVGKVHTNTDFERKADSKIVSAGSLVGKFVI